MRLGIVIEKAKMEEANAFFDDLNPENNGNSLPNVELVDSSGTVVADYCDLVPRDIERLKAMEKFGGLQGRELSEWTRELRSQLFDRIEDHFDGKARIYEVVKDPQEEKQVSSVQEVFAKEGLNRKETEDIQ